MKSADIMMLKHNPNLRQVHYKCPPVDIIPSPLYQGEGEIKLWYLSFLSLYVDFLLTAMFTFLP